MKHIVIIGGGFAGINLIERLSKKNEFIITLVDKNNYNFFPPLLYQLSTGFLEVSNISYPFRKLFRQKKNVNFHLGEVEKVIPSENKIILSTGELTYDYLVFATGTTTNYFGMDNVKKNALPMKTVNDALELRNHILKQVELAAISKDKKEQNKLLNIVVAGGGPTGVEISGMLADMKKDILPKDYPEIIKNKIDAEIYLVDGVDAVLKPMSEKSQKDTLKALMKMGVTVGLNMQVKDYSNDVVTFTNGTTIETKTLIWAAGVTGLVFEGLPPECYGRGKRLIVDEYNRVKGLNNIFAIGDTSIQSHELKFPNGHPQMAQVAIQHGVNLAENFESILREKFLKPFVYNDKGSMAIIGRNRAVVDMPDNKMHFNGFLAWFMWLFIHLLSLVKNRNRITTLYNWAGAYITKDQSLRMIVRPSKT
ncbi:NAD(P)/FAD-dependent oxidoreductase [Mucilaginibacter sp. McL0603]|uniref:NAD(P)/FAD-dependent oxidoreductase n=1 Tax=Mucilaginibacter sp. McL0603 TaxID=3415670 RepID=UPI003CE963EE